MENLKQQIAENKDRILTNLLSKVDDSDFAGACHTQYIGSQPYYEKHKWYCTVYVRHWEKPTLYITETSDLAAGLEDPYEEKLRDENGKVMTELTVADLKANLSEWRDYIEDHILGGMGWNDPLNLLPIKYTTAAYNEGEFDTDAEYNNPAREAEVLNWLAKTYL